MAKILYVVETYTEGLGYIDNVLPFELALSGHEVSVITARLPAYYQSKANFFGSLGVQSTRPGDIEVRDGVSIFTLGYKRIGGRIVFKGFDQVIRKIDPDVVVVRGISSPVLVQVALAKIKYRFRLFTSTGQAYSAIPKSLAEGGIFSRPRLTNFFSKYLLGRLLSLFVEKCIASTDDGARAVTEFYGVPPAKVAVIRLGVDTKKFTPVGNDAFLRSRRLALREELGVAQDEVLCIWTGRMTPSKGLTLLAEVIEDIVALGYSYRVLFVGDGTEYEALKKYPSSILHPFVKWLELPDFYRAADLAVWPRSITTSTLDASACGLPIVMSSEESATERWDGIGMTYKNEDPEALKNALLFFADSNQRKAMGEAGVARMRTLFSWKTVASQFESIFFGS